ncbi:Bcr/CflA family efflux MFS transporter [Legionella sp. D16C41]|uniref:Bcr/CflA family efflux MFS transporter n=1 Tax=Legionella sp. D16C41 TaxID=3402688 RepID=UPI003AF850F2
MSDSTKLFLYVQSILLLMLVQLGTDIYLPSVPAIYNDLGTDESVVKLSLNVMIIALGFSQLLYGPLSDYIGRKPIIITGLIIFIIGSSLLILPQSIFTLILGRTIQGLGLGFGLSIGSAIACDIYNGKTLNKAISVISALYAVMPVVAPVMGGTLQTYLGWQANFYFLFICGIIMFCLIKFFFKETNVYAGSQDFRLNNLITIYYQCLKNKAYTYNLFIATLFYAGEVSYIIQMPLVAQETFGLSPMQTGWLIIFTSAAIIVGSSFSTILINRLSANALIFLGVICATLGIILSFIFMIFSKHTLVTFISPMVLFMLGSGFAFPNCIANCLEVFPNRAGAATALALGLLTLLGGCLTIIVAKIPAHNHWALSFFVVVTVFLMLITSLFLYRTAIKQV